ncbi:MFS transporter [Cohnella nanjingensis]|uniref:MFS transporter n=1 Tax=Cohnella nanjingensis TaxID=1387779 RepID=A0A7X0RR16_9BACL|nr:MFS transporter [Cohnella nanjingensis]MBB6672062.1 MFS transporter [Cohnella nanjingensis]
MSSERQRQAGDRLIRILAFTLAISVMSGTMFNLALPEIMREYRLSFAQVSWIASAYLLIFAVGTVLYGKLADSYKLKTLITIGIILLSFGCLLGLTSRNFETVLIGRMIQAAGSAVIPATAAILPVRYFPQERRGRALGIAMTGGAIGSAIGPAVAALLISAVHWRYLFCVPLLTVLVLPYYRKYLIDEPLRRGRIDWLGGGLLAGTVALLLLAITNRAWPPAAGSFVCFLLFAARIRTAKEPFMKPELFRSKGYGTGLTLAFLGTGVGYSLPFLSPQLLTQVQHLSAGWVGLVMVPAATATAALGRTGGKLADLQGNGFLFYAASLLFFTCFALLSSFAAAAPLGIAFFLIFGNIGQTFSYIALSNAISRTLPKEQVGVGMGLLSMLNFIAGAVCSSLYSTMVDRGAGSGWNPAQSHPAAFVYSNIYLLLALVVLLMSGIYYLQFNRKGRSVATTIADLPRRDLS